MVLKSLSRSVYDFHKETRYVGKYTKLEYVMSPMIHTSSPSIIKLRKTDLLINYRIRYK